MSKSERRNRRHFRDQPVDLFTTKLDVEDLFCIRIESRERTERRFKHAHRMSVVVETIDYLLDALIDEGVIGDVFGPALELCSCREFTIEQQIRDFEVSALLRKLLDRISAILENAFVAVDEGDTTLARRCIHKRRVVRHQAKILVRNLDLTQVHGLDRAVLNW